MSKYSEREKLGHFNKLRGHASHVDADLKLLEHLDPKSELLSSAKSSNLGDKVLMALLDLTTSCDITAYRREYCKHRGLSSGELFFVKYIDNYNKNIVLLIAKYGVDTELDTEEKIKDVFDSLGFTPFIENVVSEDNKTIFDMLGCTLRDCVLLEPFDVLDIKESIPTEEQFRSGILNLITDSITQRDSRRKSEFETQYKTKVKAYVKQVGADFVFSSVEEVAIMLQMLGLSMPDPQKGGDFVLADLIGIPFSELPFSKVNFEHSELTSVIEKYKAKQTKAVISDSEKEDLDAKVEELKDKEQELSDKEQDLEVKESELDDKEQELAEKEEVLENQSKESKKKAEPKKKNTQK